MNEILSQFHFVRPEWFYALPPAVLLYMMLKYRQSTASNWEKAVDSDLLPFLLDNPDGQISKSPMTLLLVAWLMAIFALAGPVWQKTDQPVHEREDALVILLDLTRSMYATDVKPNRLVRARRKLQDLLNLRKEGVTGLIAFAGDAHVVSPLTDDTDTISSMVPALTPNIMPAPGSQLGPALDRAISLFSDAGVGSGRILIITDEVRDVAEAQARARKNRFNYPISVLSVGTLEGAPIPAGDEGTGDGYLKDRNGNLVIPKVNRSELSELASIAGGRYAAMTLTDEDLDYLLAPDPLASNERFIALERDFDIWREEGPWLLLLLLPLASLAFRRGWLWALVLVCMLPAEKTYAFEWADLWWTKDQQGQRALEREDPQQAARLFQDPAWKGTAQYRSEKFQDAAGQFDNIMSPDGRYNLGNAFAKQGRYEEAIEAYDEALTMAPDHEDAAFNKELVEQLLQQQQQQQQNQDQSQDQENQQDQEGESEDQQQQAGEDQEQPNEEQPQPEPGEEQAEQDQEQLEAEQNDELDTEEEQALKQWLRRVPDDPGGLLRRKFRAQHEQRLTEGQVSRIEGGDW